MDHLLASDSSVKTLLKVLIPIALVIGWIVLAVHVPVVAILIALAAGVPLYYILRFGPWFLLGRWGSRRLSAHQDWKRDRVDRFR